MLWSHHPMCSAYGADMFRVGHHYFCLGCFVSYPLAALIVLAFLFHAPLTEVPFYWWLLPGLVGGGIQVLSSKGFTRSKTSKFLVKVALGIGLGSMTLFVWAIPTPWWHRLTAFIICLQGLSLMAAERENVISQKCLDCAFQAHWDRCPGFIKANPGLATSFYAPPGPPPDYPVPEPGSRTQHYMDPKTGKVVKLPRPLT